MCGFSESYFETQEIIASKVVKTENEEINRCFLVILSTKNTVKMLPINAILIEKEYATFLVNPAVLLLNWSIPSQLERF